MKYPLYEKIVVSKDFSRWNFTSIGKKGPIRKQVSFTSTGISEVYNLAFGDLGVDGEIDDLIVSDNVVVMKEQKTPKTWVSKSGTTYVISEELNRKEGEVDAPRKLAKAIETLERTKDSLPFNVDKTKK